MMALSMTLKHHVCRRHIGYEKCMPYLWILHACVCVLKGRDAGIPERIAELALRAPSTWTICMICALLKDKQ